MKNIKLNIKENRLSYGTITPSNSGYKVLFFNPITKKNTYVGSRSTKEEAEKLFNETNYNFFSENSKPFMHVALQNKITELKNSIK